MFDGQITRTVSLNITTVSLQESNAISLDNATMVINTMSSPDCRLVCNLISPAKKVIIYFISPLFLVFGLCCTIILLISICHRNRKYSTDCFILGFSIAEVLKYMGGFTVLGRLYLIMYFKSLPIELFELLTSKYWLEVLYRYPSSVSKVIVAITSVERLVAVFQPFKFREIRTFRNGKIITITTYGICGIVFGSSQMILNVNAGAIYSTFVCLAVMATICISNIATLFGLARTSYIISSLSDEQVKQRIKSQRKLTKVLLTISFVCVVCTILPLILHVSAIIDKEGWETQKSEMYWIILVVFAPLFDLVLSVFSLAYFIINDEQIRESILELCCCNRCCINRRTTQQSH